MYITFSFKDNICVTDFLRATIVCLSVFGYDTEDISPLIVCWKENLEGQRNVWIWKNIMEWFRWINVLMLNAMIKWMAITYKKWMKQIEIYELVFKDAAKMSETNYHSFISSNVFSSLNSPWGVCQVTHGGSNVKRMFCHLSLLEINCISIYEWYFNIQLLIYVAWYRYRYHKLSNFHKCC